MDDPPVHAECLKGTLPTSLGKKAHAIKSFFYFCTLTKSWFHLYPLTLDASSLNTPSLFCAREPKRASNTLKSFPRTLCDKITHGQWCHVPHRSVSSWLVCVTLCVCWTWVGCVHSRSIACTLYGKMKTKDESCCLIGTKSCILVCLLKKKKKKKPSVNPVASTGSWKWFKSNPSASCGHSFQTVFDKSSHWQFQ